MKSIVYFTTHKCASTFLAGFLKKLSHLQKMECVDHSYRIWTHNQNPKHHSKGRIYGPYRRFYPLDDIEQYKLVLNIRDVRDVLTSHYYSIAYSHGVPQIPGLKESFLKRREAAKNSTIDEFVLDQAKEFHRRYKAYQEAHDQHNMLLLRYEDMIVNFSGWLDKFLEHCEIEINEHGRKALMKFDQFKPKKENVQSNKRQVSAGDHKNKLKCETIEVLNSIFEDVPIAFYKGA